jgi:hypothetical protein
MIPRPRTVLFAIQTVNRGGSVILLQISIFFDARIKILAQL